MPLLQAGRPVVHPHVAYLAPCATLLGSVRTFFSLVPKIALVEQCERLENLRPCLHHQCRQQQQQHHDVCKK